MRCARRGCEPKLRVRLKSGEDGWRMASSSFSSSVLWDISRTTTRTRRRPQPHPVLITPQSSIRAHKELFSSSVWLGC